MRAFIAGLLLALVCSGCNIIQPGIPGSGNLQSEFRTVAPFHQIDLSGVGTVDVMVGDRPSVQVATDDNLLPLVETNVRGGTLEIKTRGSVRPRSGIHVNVTVPQLTATSVSGAGDMRIRNVSGDSIEMNVSGAGSVTADGYVQNLRTRISGAGNAELQELVSRSADVRVSGAGDANVYALESLSANVSGAGDVTCHGNPPRVNKKVSGAGDIKLIQGESMQLNISDQYPRPQFSTVDASHF